MEPDKDDDTTGNFFASLGNDEELAHTDSDKLETKPTALRLCFSRWMTRQTLQLLIFYVAIRAYEYAPAK
jgi:hypothetical protein